MESEQIPVAFDAAEEAFGTVNILINNSGIVIAGKYPEIPEDDWDAVVGTNLKGAWMMAQEAARRMIAAETGGQHCESCIDFSISNAEGTFHLFDFEGGGGADDAYNGSRTGRA